jgi:hypothetical protein
MRLMRNVALIGIAKKLYDESRKPENQKRIQDAIAKARAQRSTGARRRP